MEWDLLVTFELCIYFEFIDSRENLSEDVITVLISNFKIDVTIVSLTPTTLPVAISMLNL